MKIRDIAAIALFAAFITALGFIPPVFVPFFPAVPLSVHSMGPILAGACLGAKRGFYAVALFWILLLAGLAFAGGSTGPAAFMGPMGGYIGGFGLAALIIGLAYHYWPHPIIAQEFLFMAVGGIIALYAAGIVWLMFLTKISLTQALWLNAIFLPGDSAKIILCIFIRRRLYRNAPHAFHP